jgi:hypothetical protein
MTINLISVLVDDAIALCRLQIGCDHLRDDFAKRGPRSPAQFRPGFAGIPDKGVHFGWAEIAWVNGDDAAAMAVDPLFF